jgi:hypothetical protein
MSVRTLPLRLVGGGGGGVVGAQLVPGTGRLNISAPVSGVLSKDDGETGVQVPVNVAVEEPGAWVIGDKTNGDVVGGGGTSVDDVALGLQGKGIISES